jgi:hypothetical protein
MLVVVRLAALYDKDGVAIMPEWIWLVGAVLVWFVLTQWVLPKLGVPT